MGRWIKGKDGKFVGSVGDGKTQVPSTGRRVAAMFGFGTTDQGTTQTAVPDLYEQWKASQPPARDTYAAAAGKADLVGRNLGADFSAQQALRHAAEQYSASDEGQVKVLTDAVAAARDGNLRRANILLEAAEKGRAARDAEVAGNPDLWRMSTFIERMEPTQFDRVDQAISDFHTACSTPVQVPPAGNEPGTTLPYSGTRAAEAIQRVAGAVTSSSSSSPSSLLPSAREVYGSALAEEGVKFSGISYCHPERGQEQYAAREYHDFVRKVDEAHKGNRQLVIYRAERLLRAAESVAYHNSPAGQSRFAL